MVLCTTATTGTYVPNKLPDITGTALGTDPTAVSCAVQLKLQCLNELPARYTRMQQQLHCKQECVLLPARRQDSIQWGGGGSSPHPKDFVTAF